MNFKSTLIAGYSTLQRAVMTENHDPERSIMVAGSGRSGTTWVGDLINWDHSSRVMFEPFHPGRTSEVGHFSARQYCRTGCRDPRFVDPAMQILSGRVHNGWVDRHNRKLRVDSRIIKEVRANLLLAWLKDLVPGLKIVFVIRNPFAVLASRLKAGWPTPFELAIAQPDLMEDHLAPYAEAFLNASSPLERSMHWWCIENFIPLRQFRENQVLVCLYEDLVDFPDREMRRIYNYLAVPYAEGWREQFSKPSKVTNSGSTRSIASGTIMIDKWASEFSRYEIARGRTILGQYGLEGIFFPESGGRISGADVLRVTMASDESGVYGQQ